MLAQNFKTSVELGISVQEFEALKQVLGMFERGEIKFHPRGYSMFVTSKSKFKEPLIGFHMAAFYGHAPDCGTVACICGWAEYVGGLEPLSLSRKRFGNPELFYLFETCGINANEIQPHHAAIALRNYLTTGTARWKEVMKEEK